MLDVPFGAPQGWHLPSVFAAGPCFWIDCSNDDAFIWNQGMKKFERLLILFEFIILEKKFAGIFDVKLTNRDKL